MRAVPVGSFSSLTGGQIQSLIPVYIAVKLPTAHLEIMLVDISMPFFINIRFGLKRDFRLPTFPSSTSKYPILFCRTPWAVAAIFVQDLTVVVWKFAFKTHGVGDAVLGIAVGGEVLGIAVGLALGIGVGDAVGGNVGANVGSACSETLLPAEIEE